MRRIFLILAFALVPCFADAEVYNVRDFGAAGDGKTLDSPAINRAVEAAGAAGGGRVYVPAGHYLSYSIRLASNIDLYLEQGAVIVAAAPQGETGYDAPEKPLNDKYQGFGHNHIHNSLIYGENLRDITISGPGRIDGSALDSWTEGLPGHGNKAVGLRGCTNVKIKDVTIYRGGHFALHLTAVDNLFISGVTIDSDRDGMDIICCRNVTVTSCVVNTPEDDSIVLKSNYAMDYFRDTENVTITNCRISGYRCGSLLDGTLRRFPAGRDEYRSGGRIKLGTESSGGYRNIAISNCTFDYCGGLVFESMDGGDLEDVTVSNITMRHVLYCPIFIRLGARMRSPEGTPVGHIRRMNISNVMAYDADSRTSCIISGIPGHYVEDIVLSNIRIWYSGGCSDSGICRNPPEFEKDYPEPWMFGMIPARGFYVRHARNIVFDDVKFYSYFRDVRPDYVMNDTENLFTAVPASLSH